MDTLTLEGLIVRGRHGAYEEEWENPQDFQVDIIAVVDITLAAKTDKLEDTVNWTFLESVAKEIIEGPSIRLIERMADMIAGAILERESRVKKVTVTVKKREVRVNGVPGVTLTKTQHK